MSQAGRLIHAHNIWLSRRLPAQRMSGTQNIRLLQSFRQKALSRHTPPPPLLSSPECLKLQQLLSSQQEHNKQLSSQLQALKSTFLSKVNSLEAQLDAAHTKNKHLITTISRLLLGEVKGVVVENGVVSIKEEHEQEDCPVERAVNCSQSQVVEKEEVGVMSEKELKIKSNLYGVMIKRNQQTPKKKNIQIIHQLNMLESKKMEFLCLRNSRLTTSKCYECIRCESYETVFKQTFIIVGNIYKMIKGYILSRESQLANESTLSLF